MRETDIVDEIRRLSARAAHRETRLIRGIGDDCAVLRPRPHEDWVFTTDLALEGRHFTRETHKAADIGHKALARSLSDLAAMGSEPVFSLVSLAVPPALSGVWLKSFYRGLLALAKTHRLVVAGGDLGQFENVIIDVMCAGHVPRGEAMLRSAARAGDRIYATGTLGASANGFATQRGENWRRHLRPEPRVKVGIALRNLGVIAAMDLSDGLSLDLARLCRESKVSATLSGDLPIAAGASLDDALDGGEDYELLFTAPPRLKIPSEIEGVAVSCIGEIKAGAGRVTWRGRRLRAKGYDHFA